jgi:uncharacterized protein YbjT (DUF2867 family)
MKAFVAGATGETGRRIVTQLFAKDIKVKALVRDRAHALTVLPENVELVEGDLSDVSGLKMAMAGCDVILSATGARPNLNPMGPYGVDYLGTKNLVIAAKQAELQQFVMVSSLCVSKLFHPLNLFWLILVWKRQGEVFLQNSGIPYTIVRPGGLKSEDVVLPIVMKGADQLFEGSIPRLQVASICVEALNQPQAQHKILEVVCDPDSPNYPIPELLAQVALA